MTTDRASVPTRISIGSRPMERQASTSSSLIGRLALEMSDAPSTQNRSKPPPEPIESIEYSGPPSSIQRVSTAVDSGNTVDDPAIPMSPDATSSGSTNGRPHGEVSPPPAVVVSACVVVVAAAVVVVVSSPSASSSPQAAATSASASTRAAIRPNLRNILCLLLLGWRRWTPARRGAKLHRQEHATAPGVTGERSPCDRNVNSLRGRDRGTRGRIGALYSPPWWTCSLSSSSWSLPQRSVP